MQKISRITARIDTSLRSLDTSISRISLLLRSKQENVDLPDTLILVLRNKVVNLVTGQTVLLDADYSGYNADKLASSVFKLVESGGASSKIGLLLPNDEFVATTVNIPKMAPELMHKAITMQATQYIPGIQEDVMLAYHVDPDRLHAPGLAIWYKAGTSERLFKAFKAYGMSVVFILPRIISQIPADTKQGCIIEEEDKCVTRLEWMGGHITKWMQVTNDDLGEDDSPSELKSDLYAKNDSGPCIHIGQEYDWKNSKVDAEFNKNYRIVPNSAKKEMENISSARNKRLLKLVAISAFTICLLPYIYLFSAQIYLQASLSSIKSETVEISNIRDEVVSFETFTGPLSNFPSQNVVSVLGELNKNIPEDSWFDSFEIKNGFVEVRGYSPNPEKLLEIIANNQNFEDVAFSQATRGQSTSNRGSHFGIRFKLQGVDVRSYLAEYFPVDR